MSPVFQRIVAPFFRSVSGKGSDLVETVEKLDGFARKSCWLCNCFPHFPNPTLNATFEVSIFFIQIYIFEPASVLRFPSFHHRLVKGPFWNSARSLISSRGTLRTIGSEFCVGRGICWFPQGSNRRTNDQMMIGVSDHLRQVRVRIPSGLLFIIDWTILLKAFSGLRL